MMLCSLADPPPERADDAVHHSAEQDHTPDAIVCAQAFHWFVNVTSLAEILRAPSA
ncbi:MAG TPA: hypothetical protein VJS18_01175 [Paraburkholderia sp.]|nr:hypothetical protein [Paraburkholderia sp.]